MTDIFEKAILIATGLERKAMEALDELADAGKKKADTETSGGDDEGLPSDKAAQNRLVEEGVRASKDIIELLKEGKDKFERSVHDTAETLVEKLNVATRSDLDTVTEMARKAREKVDKLEKRVKELEGAGKSAKKR